MVTVLLGAIFIILCLMLGVAYIRLLRRDWANLEDDSFVLKEKIDLPMADGWNMVALVIKRKAR